MLHDSFHCLCFITQTFYAFCISTMSPTTQQPQPRMKKNENESIEIVEWNGQQSMRVVNGNKRKTWHSPMKVFDKVSNRNSARKACLDRHFVLASQMQFQVKLPVRVIRAQTTGERFRTGRSSHEQCFTVSRRKSHLTVASWRSSLIISVSFYEIVTFFKVMLL